MRTAVAMFAVLACLVPLSHSRADDVTALQVAGRIEAVTVYRGQALITRLIDVQAQPGMHELIVRDLPAEMVSASIYAESAQGVRIRSVRYRTRPEQEDVRQEVRDLDRNIKATERQMQVIANQRHVVAAQQQMLDKLEAFTAPTAQTELTRGVLNAETLKDLTHFHHEQRRELAAADLRLQFEHEDLAEQLAQLRCQRDVITQRSARTAREAVVFLDLEQPQAQFRLRYLVNEATWQPSYNVRAGADRQAIALEYLASIRQRSGEDWHNVAMTLSTATPMLASEAPRLAALTVSLTDEASAARQLLGSPRDKDRAYEERVFSYHAEARDILRQRGIIDSQARTNNVVLDDALNRITGEQQILDMYFGAGRSVRRRADENQQTVSVVYNLDGPTTLPSRADHQLIRIAERSMPAEFYRLAMPLLTEFIYEEAQAVNIMDAVLLAGPVSSYLDGQFVGHGELPTIAAGESFTVGLGIDASLRAERQLIDRTESTQGGNRVVKLHYRLSVANFSAADRAVRLLDRLPVAAQDMDIRVDLVSTSEAPHASDSRAAQQDRLRWDGLVAAHAAGDDAWSVDYIYTLQHDRQKHLQSALR